MEHVGEPLLAQQEVARALQERRRAQKTLQGRRRETERGSLETCLKGPGEVGARCVGGLKKSENWGCCNSVSSRQRWVSVRTPSWHMKSAVHIEVEHM